MRSSLCELLVKKNRSKSAAIDLAHIIEARVEEIFALMMQEIKRSGYDGLLPAGLVLTGGSSQLTGIRELASEVMGLPCRVARPENLIGMVDRLHSPSFSTSVGLVQYAMQMKAVDPAAVRDAQVCTRDAKPDKLGNELKMC